MFKSRKKILEEEAKQEGLTPTEDLKVDESSLSEEEKGHFEIPLTFIIVAAIIIVAMIVFAIVVIVSGGPVVSAANGANQSTSQGAISGASDLLI